LIQESIPFHKVFNSLQEELPKNSISEKREKVLFGKTDTTPPLWIQTAILQDV